MTAADSTDFQAYLESICSDEKYLGWQDFYTPTDASPLHRQRIEKKQPPRRLNLSSMVQTIVPQRETEAAGKEKAEKEQGERLEVLAGLRKYAQNHVLLVGKPGSGKSTALERLLWEEAEKGRGAGEQGSGGAEERQTKIPVLVQLRYYQTSVLDLIRSFLKQHGLLLEIAKIEQLLFEQKFLLLVDGLNELHSEDARLNLIAFRRENAATPMIFTTRELAGDIGIEKKLEMQPLTEEQMRQFVLTYLPEAGERLLQQLQGRLREFGETPLLLWMLCELFNNTGNIPPNLGLVFRCFAQSYDSQIKHDVSTDESRSRWFLLLQHLAFEMMRGKTATDFRLTIPKQEAEDILTEFLATKKFDKPRECAFIWLKDLLKYHLIQLTNSNREIEFHHQLLQEYYAAERLLVQLPQLSDDTLKRDYLNYLKWTEPLALMLALVEDEAQALRVVKLALEVDLQLGARLVWEMKPEFKEKTVDLVVELEIHRSVKVKLLHLTNSVKAVPALMQALNDENSDVRKSAALALGNIGNSQAIEALKQALNYHKDYFVCSIAALALVNIGNSQAIEALKQAFTHKDSFVREVAFLALGKSGVPQPMLPITTYLKKLFPSLEGSFGIQKPYYNYIIYQSRILEKNKAKNPIIDRLDTINQTLQTIKTMSETPKYDFSGASFSNFGSVTGDIQGDVNNIGTQHNYAPKQNLAESAAEIQQLLEQLAKNNQTIVQSDDRDVIVSAIQEEIKRNPTIKARLWNALKAGGTEALKVALDAIFKNPAVSISVETIKGFIEAE